MLQIWYSVRSILDKIILILEFKTIKNKCDLFHTLKVWAFCLGISSFRSNILFKSFCCPRILVAHSCSLQFCVFWLTNSKQGQCHSSVICVYDWLWPWYKKYFFYLNVMTKNAFIYREISLKNERFLSELKQNSFWILEWSAQQTRVKTQLI